MTLAAFVAIWFLHLLAAVSPGPAVLMAARTGVTQGMRAGSMLALGIGVGGIIWASAALFGLAVLFEAAPSLLWGFKIVGGLYLTWMGWSLWRSADTPLDASDAATLPRNGAQAFRIGIVTQLANPKPAILFSAIFLGTVPPGTNAWAYAAILLAVFANETIWNMAVARVFSFDRTRRAYLGFKSLLDRSFGVLLAGLGVKVAAT